MATLKYEPLKNTHVI